MSRSSLQPDSNADIATEGPTILPNFHADRAARYFLLFLLLNAAVSMARADPIATYTVTNLGSGPITLATSNGGAVPVDFSGRFYGYYGGSLTSVTNGAAVVAVSNGQAPYAFTFTPDTPLAPNQGIMSGIPLGVPAPVNAGTTYGNPANAFSFVSAALMNSQGMVAALDLAGVNGHSGWGSVYTVQRNADGTWGWPATLWSASGYWNGGLPTSAGASLVGINKLNQVLGTTGDQYGNANTVVYDLTRNTLTGLSNLVDAAGTSYTNTKPYAIDDQGRILLQGIAFPSGAEETLLLTPDGVSAEPLAVPAPEPSSLAVMVIAMAAFALAGMRRRWR
jgi:hypothetical protein